MTTGTTKTPSPAQLARQKMINCNHQAGSQSIKGDKRKAFMSQCLKGLPSHANPAKNQQEKAASPSTEIRPQNKMKACNAKATIHALKGNARKTFISDCLRKS